MEAGALEGEGEGEDSTERDPGPQRLRGRNIWGQGPRRQQSCLEMRGEREVSGHHISAGPKAFGIYAIGTGESRKVLEQAGDMVRAVLK